MREKIKDLPGYVKDKKSKAVLCTDKGALENYKRQRMKQDRINSLEEEVKSLRSDITKILTLLEKHGTN